MLPCERQMLRQTTLWEEPHRHVCNCICMTALGFTVFVLYYCISQSYYFIYYIFTVFHNHTTLFTIFLLYFIIPGFCCPHVTDLNLVLLLYYFIIALSRFLNLKWALCLIKSKLQVDWLRGLPRVTPKVASNSHHCFSVCFLIQGQQLETFWFTRSLWCYITEHFTINYMNGHKILFLLHCINWHESGKTRNCTINYINGRQNIVFTALY